MKSNSFMVSAKRRRGGLKIIEEKGSEKPRSFSLSHLGEVGMRDYCAQSPLLNPSPGGEGRRTHNLRRIDSSPASIVSFEVENEKRTWPSPCGPNTTPGTVAT